jgi:hypothetical protein
MWILKHVSLIGWREREKKNVGGNAREPLKKQFQNRGK